VTRFSPPSDPCAPSVAAAEPPAEPAIEPLDPLAMIPADWPHRAASRRVPLDGAVWHVQEVGTGPVLLLLHGTGGSTHSWAPIIDRLGARYRCIAVDLPGHGFTDVPADPTWYTIPGMAQGLGRLLRTLGITPHRVAGHSAGVPVLLQMARLGLIAPDRIIGVNPALIPPPATYMTLLAPLLSAMVEPEPVARGGAWLARGTRLIEWMLATSGSRLTPEQLARYRWLCERPGHVHAALTMMARWDLPRLLRDVAALTVPLEIFAGSRDRWVPPRPLAVIADGLPFARFHTLTGGHLLPEEHPDQVAEVLCHP